MSTAANAQLAPDLKSTSSSTVDPSLLPILLWDPAGFSLNFSTLKQIAGASITAADPTDLSGFSLNFRPVAEMLSQLKARGATIDTAVHKEAGLTYLNLTIDGKKIAPIVVECRDCVIVFEY